MTQPARSLDVIFYDGDHGQAQQATMCCDGEHLMLITDQGSHSFALPTVDWPEPLGHALRVMNLPTGGSVQTTNTRQFDTWALAYRPRYSPIERLQKSLRWVAASVVALGVVVGVLVIWGIPWVARVSIPFVPERMDALVGESAFEAFDKQFLEPSNLALEQRQRIADRFEQVVNAPANGPQPSYQLYFRSGRLGANAFALPGGTMVLTDEMVTLVQGDEDVLAGILAHEMGHVHYRHGMQAVMQAMSLAVVGSALLGDYSSWLAAAPIALGQASYSRQAEHQADTYAAGMLSNAAVSPKVMVTLFDQLNNDRKKSESAATSDLKKGANVLWRNLPIAFSSHPPDQDRVDYFLAQAKACTLCKEH
jgi:Zn-dependent protease with chaperone function